MDTPKQLNLFEFARRVAMAPTKPPAAPVRRAVMPDMETLERKLAGARQELHNLQVMQLRPNQSPEKLDLLDKFERSCRAEIKLRLRAIEYQRSLEGG
jgi:hypothetical protein